MKIKHLISILVGFLFPIVGYASPNWHCDISAYEYDMTVYASLKINDSIISPDDYLLAAFCGDECRGIAQVESTNDSRYFYLRIRSNSKNGETISFKAFDTVTNSEVPDDDLRTFITFENQDLIGYPSSPYPITFTSTYTITPLPSSNGTITGGGTYEHGTLVSLTATPNEGYSFEAWSNGVTDNPYSFTATESIEISASYTINYYTITYSIGEEVVGTQQVPYGSVIEPNPAPSKEGYTFAGWQDVPETMPAHDIEIIGSYTVNSYKLTYTVDGETYKEYTVEYGSAVTAEAEPEKEGYTFSGWEGLPETMPAHDVMVSGSFSVNSYKAVFRIDDEVIETKSITFGSPIETPEAPEKEGHTFAGWQDVPETMPAHDIEVVGSYTVNSYKLTYTVDGETYKEYTVEYGSDITAEAEPEKEGYTFSGWEELPETMPAHDVTVNGTFSVNSYTAVFKIGDEVIETKSITFGSLIETPKAPEKEGYTFAGWQDVPETMPAHDIEVTGTYTVNSYKLTYTVDGETYKEYSVEYGSEVAAEANPEKEGYKFSGWEGLPEIMPAHDVTVSGSFSINSYNAVFKIDGEVIETKTIVYGGTVETPEAPAKEGHTFAGWQDVPETMPARDIEITGSYTVNSYKLVYTVDGETYKEYTLKYGSAVTAEANPEKEGYTFSGWEGVPETMPAHDVTVIGSFSINSYNAVFRIGDEVIEKKSIVYGSPVEVPEAPTKEGHTFGGWQNVPETMPARDIEITGSYTVNSYKLVYTVDGEAYKEYTLKYGSAVTAEANPEKEGYTFSGWEGVPETMPAHDVTVSGSFSINSYNAVFRIGDEVIEKKSIVYGSPVEVPEAPTKEGHTFAGWQDVPETMPARDIEVTGSYTVNSYKLVYMVDGETYKEYTVGYGSDVKAEANPEKEGYTFSGWEGVPETMPAHDVTVSGSFSINSYKAVFRIGDEVIETKSIVYGSPVEVPEAPAKEGHTFAGWQDVPETMPAHDIEVTGSYTVNSYKLTYTVDGETYKEYTIEYGSDVPVEAEPEKEGYTFSGWEGLPETMPAHDVTVSGSFSINSYEAVFRIGDEVIERKSITFGSPIETPEAPEKEGHTFAGWQEIPETMPAHDIDIEGSYIVNSYQLSIYLNGDLISSEQLVYGTKIEIEVPEVPEGMKFDGWTSEIPETMPAHDVEIYGSYSEADSVDMIELDGNAVVTVYDLTGRLIIKKKTWSEVKDILPDGIYIINRVKILIRN